MVVEAASGSCVVILVVLHVRCPDGGVSHAVCSWLIAVVMPAGR